MGKKETKSPIKAYKTELGKRVSFIKHVEITFSLAGSGSDPPRFVPFAVPLFPPPCCNVTHWAGSAAGSQELSCLHCDAPAAHQPFLTLPASHTALPLPPISAGQLQKAQSYLGYKRRQNQPVLCLSLQEAEGGRMRQSTQHRA